MTCSGLKYVHPDRNLLLEVKKPPSVPMATKVAVMREGTFLRLHSGDTFVTLLSSELVIILSWHALFPEYISFHVSLALSQDL